MNADSRAAVVIPVFNCATHVRLQIEAVCTQELDVPFEVIAVDNGSSDGSVAVLEAMAALDCRVRVLRCSTPGVNAARNAGTAATDARWIAYTDCDDVVQPGWLAALVNALRDGADLVGGGLDHDLLNDPVVASWRDRPSGVTTSHGFLPMVTGTSCAVRREAWQAVGGWPEQFRGGGDDVAFSWDIALAGFSVRGAPDAIVAYRHRSSVRAIAQQSFGYGRAETRVFATYRHHGLRRRRGRAVARSYLSLLLRLPAAVVGGRAARGAWVRLAALLAGRAWESLRLRTTYL